MRTLQYNVQNAECTFLTSENFSMVMLDNAKQNM